MPLSKKAKTRTPDSVFKTFYKSDLNRQRTQTQLVVKILDYILASTF